MHVLHRFYIISIHCTSHIHRLSSNLGLRPTLPLRPAPLRVLSPCICCEGPRRATAPGSASRPSAAPPREASRWRAPAAGRPPAPPASVDRRRALEPPGGQPRKGREASKGAPTQASWGSESLQIQKRSSKSDEISAPRARLGQLQGFIQESEGRPDLGSSTPRAFPQLYSMRRNSARVADLWIQ